MVTPSAPVIRRAELVAESRRRSCEARLDGAVRARHGDGHFPLGQPVEVAECQDEPVVGCESVERSQHELALVAAHEVILGTGAVEVATVRSPNHECRPAAACTAAVARRVGDDAQEPRSYVGAWVEPRRCAQGALGGVLHHVVGTLRRAEYDGGDPQCTASM
jgi:hypothetical protein